MICPKCRYHRTIKDDAEIPNYQCPSCGIIYEKYRQRQLNIDLNHPRITVNQSAPTKIVSNRLKIIASCGIVILIGAKSYVSPSTFMADFRDTLFNKNASDLTEYIDFEKLKTNTKAAIKANIHFTPEQERNPFFKIGQNIGDQMLNTVIDQAISPEGIKAQFNQYNKIQEDQDGSHVFDFHYLSFNKVTIDLGETLTILERNGLFSWVIVAMDKK